MGPWHHVQHRLKSTLGATKHHPKRRVGFALNEDLRGSGLTDSFSVRSIVDTWGLSPEPASAEGMLIDRPCASPTPRQAHISLHNEMCWRTRRATWSGTSVSVDLFNATNSLGRDERQLHSRDRRTSRKALRSYLAFRLFG